MSVALDTRLGLATNSFPIHHNDLMVDPDDEEQLSDGNVKTENGTQTKISRSKGVFKILISYVKIE